MHETVQPQGHREKMSDVVIQLSKSKPLSPSKPSMLGRCLVTTGDH